jgi:hypothetical protein
MRVLAGLACPLVLLAIVGCSSGPPSARQVAVKIPGCRPHPYSGPQSFVAQVVTCTTSGPRGATIWVANFNTRSNERGWLRNGGGILPAGQCIRGTGWAAIISWDKIPTTSVAAATLARRMGGRLTTIGECHYRRFALHMVPVKPLTITACIRQARHYGYSAAGGASVCAPGQARAWYRATLTNRGAYGLPACTAVGFDTLGKPVFSGRLFFGLRGLFVPAHSSITFYWYLLTRTRGPVARYSASCSPVPHP